MFTQEGNLLYLSHSFTNSTMAGFTAASSSSVAGPSKAVSSTFALTVAQSSPVNTAIAPRPLQKKKIAGYGFFYDSEDEAEAIAKQPAPKPLPSTLQSRASTTTTTTTTHSTAASFPTATMSHGYGTGIKKLVIEKKNQGHYSTGKSKFFAIYTGRRATVLDH